MTREQAIKVLNMVEAHGLADEAKRMAIKSLEQQSCEDCVSREQLKRELHAQMAVNAITKETAEDMLNHLPSVTPQPRAGRWIEKAEDYYKAINEYGGGVDENTDYFTDDIACPKCLSKFSTIDNETERFRHCPNCGAKIIELQESEGVTG